MLARHVLLTAALATVLVRPVVGQTCAVSLSPSAVTLNLVFGQPATVLFDATVIPAAGGPGVPTGVVANLSSNVYPFPFYSPFVTVTPSLATCPSFQSCGSSTVAFNVAPGLMPGVYSYTITLNAAYFGGPGFAGCSCSFTSPCPTYLPTTVTVVVTGTSPPPPTLIGMTPHRGVMTGGDVTTIVGANLSTVTSVKFGGLSASGLTIVSDSELRCTAPGYWFPAPTIVTVTTLVGSASLTGHFTYVPYVTGASPAVVAPGAPATIQLNGWGFGPTSVVNVDSVAVPTVYAAAPGGGTLTATVPQELVDDGFALTIEVQDALTGGRASPPFIVPVGSYANRGEICVTPLRPAPGVLADIRVTGMAPQAPLALIFATAPTAFAPFPDATANFGLEALSPAMIVVADGVGLGGPPVAPAAADAQGAFEAIVLMPAPVLGISGKLQALHLDAAAPSGFYLSWAYPLAF